MPLDGLHESLAAAFKSFEKVGAAKTHETFSGPGKILQSPGLCRGGWLVEQGQNIIPQTIPGKAEAVDGVHHLRGIKTAKLIFGV